MTMASVAVTQAQTTRPRTEVSEQESLQLTRNLLRIAVSNISYIRGFFPENYYREKIVPALEMKVKKLLPMDMESKRFIDWIEKGVFDALQKKYLRTLFLTICRGQDGPPVEEYSFSFKYAVGGASENITSMTIESSSGKPVHTDTNNQNSPLQMKQSACKMVRTLVQLMYELDDVPKERTIVMRLHYYDDVTPENYEPPLFESSSDEDPNPWDHEPLKIKVGHVDGRHYKLAIKVKSVLDPGDDGNELAENGTCSSDLMLSSDDDSSTSSEAILVNKLSSQPCSQLSQPCQPIQNVSPRLDTTIQASENKEQVQVSFEDKIGQPAFKAGSRRRSSRLRAIEEIAADVTDITNESPQLPKIEPERRVYQPKEDRWSNETHQNCELKSRNPLKNAKTNMISEAEKVSDVRLADGVKQSLYEKQFEAQQQQKVTLLCQEIQALLHTLPREHITMKQLQEALVDVNPANLRKLMSQMCRDGYVENTPKVRWKGRQVFHSPEADKKLQKLRAFFDSEMRENKETKVNKCDDRDLSQPWEGLIPRNGTCSILPNVKKFKQSKTLDESVRDRMQALGSVITRQGLRILQEHSSASNRHAKAIPTFQEPPLQQKAMQVLVLQRQVTQEKESTKGLEYDINFVEETGTEESESPAKTMGQLQKELDVKSEEVKRLRDRTATLESKLSEKLEDSVERAKASALSEPLNVTPLALRFKSKRVRFQDSDSPEDIDVDCALHHFKTRKVDGAADVAIYRSEFERARAEKLEGVAHKGNHSSPVEDDPYHFDVEGPDKSHKRKFRDHSIPDYSSIDSLKKGPKTDAFNNFDSFYESDERAETLKSGEKTRLSFLQRGTALKKCPRPKVYVRRSRAAFIMHASR